MRGNSNVTNGVPYGSVWGPLLLIVGNFLNSRNLFSIADVSKTRGNGFRIKGLVN